MRYFGYRRGREISSLVPWRAAGVTRCKNIYSGIVDGQTRRYEDQKMATRSLYVEALSFLSLVPSLREMTSFG